MGHAPAFHVVPKAEAARARRPHRPRRDWTRVIEALVRGETIFLSDENLTDVNVKYLQLAFARRGKGEHLRTSRYVRDGASGRVLEIER